MEIKELLAITIARGASDLHLVPPYYPTLRINGELNPLVGLPKITSGDMEAMIFGLIDPAQKEILLTNRDLDFSTMVEVKENEEYRFRGNAYFQKGHLSVSFRLIPPKISSIEDLRLPHILHDFTVMKQGFILATGASGQGKSTTLASLIQEINLTRATHIITIEDPIEYVYPSGRSIISQREMYQDTHSWTGALRSVLREDPDVVYIGDMRDLDTITLALTIAETGHLVFSTLHTNSASQTIDRIIDVFPPAAREQVKMQLSMVISGVISQRLVPKISGGRVPVCEIMLGSPSVKNIIREGKTHLLDNIIQTSKDMGMMLFEEHMGQLVKEEVISHETAIEYSLRPDIYLQLMGE